MFWNSKDCPSLKYRPRLGYWTGGQNLKYYHEEKSATSYGHWEFIKIINKKLIFNNHHYSMSTDSHQGEMFRFLREKRIKIDLIIDSRLSLSNEKVRIDALENEIRKQVSSGKINFKKAKQIAKVFKIKFTSKLVQKVIEDMETEVCEKYLDGAFDREEKKIDMVLEALTGSTVRQSYHQPTAPAYAASPFMPVGLP